MIKNETKSTKCRQCRCAIFPAGPQRVHVRRGIAEQLKDMGFCSWMCVQDYEVGANYMEYRGIHR